MKLEFAGAPEITAPREKVWERLMDPNFVAASAPGVESVEPVDPTHFSVVSGLGIGAVKLKFNLDVELCDIVEPERLRMAARGKAPGSIVDVISSVRLDVAGKDRTRLNWSATTTVGGILASVGAQLLEGTARRLTEEFWTDFARRVSAG
jgi:carbon monoxide dehydrogenase subunit G